MDNLVKFKTSTDKAFALCGVSQQRELLLAFVKWLKEDDMLQYNDKHLVDWFIKANNCG